MAAEPEEEEEEEELWHLPPRPLRPIFAEADRMEVPFATPPLQGGLGLDEEELHSGLYGGRCDDWPAATSIWRQVFLGLLVLAGAIAAAKERRPSEASFEELQRQTYGEAGNGTAAAHPAVMEGLQWLVQVDHSFDGRIAWSRYVEHGPVALGAVCLSVPSGQKRKIYEHWYLGVLGRWIPLPYLPRPGQKPGTYGLGACMLARCVCVPNLRPSDKGAAKSGAARGCWRFQGDKSAVLNVVAVPNMVLLALWQWSSNWPRMEAHATLSLANLSRGRLWVLLAAPFSHRNLGGEIIRCAVLLANAVDSFDRAGVSFAVFLLLYLGGCWAAFLARCVLWRRWLKNDTSAFWAQELGSSGGLAAQLLFLARALPEERFQFSFYMIPVPIRLGPWQSLFAHGLLDMISARSGVLPELLAHLAAWTFGWLVFDAWSRHV